MPDPGFTGTGHFVLSGFRSKKIRPYPIGRYRTVPRFPLIIFERYPYVRVMIPPL